MKMNWCYLCMKILICVWPMISNTYASLDLYVDREDARNLLGVASQLWYVQEGKVNINALNYIVIIPTHINILTFYWQNHLNSTMPYTLHVSVSNKQAVYEPKLGNIKSRGLVPNILTPWRITLNCTGRLITQAHVNITLQVPLTPSLQNITTIVIQRRKVCTERRNGSIAVEAVQGQNSTSIVYITIGLLGVFLIFIASLAAFNHIRTNKLRNRGHRARSNLGVNNRLPNNHRENACNKTSQLSLTEVRRSPLPTNTTSATTTTTTITSPDPPFNDPRLGDIEEKLKNLKGSADNLTISTLEMEGTFGRVHRGQYHPEGSHSSFSVVIKTVSDCASEVQRGVLISEGVMLNGLSHVNILPVVAAITTTEKPPLIVFRSNTDVNLKKFLQGCHTLLTREVVSLGSQVLEALSFLHGKLFLHKDIACRNCVVDEHLHLKITDCALARDIFPGDYHCLGDNENRPVKWLAYESLTHKSFSPSSDVWSWGVLLWEVMTLGQQPYVEIDPFEMVSVLRQGVRLAQPINCPDELFKAMTFCWTTQPRERPTVNELLLYLKNFLQHLDRYV